MSNIDGEDKRLPAAGELVVGLGDQLISGLRVDGCRELPCCKVTRSRLNARDVRAGLDSEAAYIHQPVRVDHLAQAALENDLVEDIPEPYTVATLGGCGEADQ